MIEYIANFLMLFGGFIIFAGGVGILKFPDFFSRLHAAGIIDSLGMILVMIGITMHNGFNLFAIKVLLLAIFIFITNPTNTHSLAKSAYIGQERGKK